MEIGGGVGGGLCLIWGRGAGKKGESKGENSTRK